MILRITTGHIHQKNIQNKAGLFVPSYNTGGFGAFGYHTTHSSMHGSGPVTSGYNKGIEVDSNGQAWIHLSYGSLKMSHDSQNTNYPSGSLHSNTSDGAVNLSNTYDIINAAIWAPQDIYDMQDFGFEELSTTQPGSVDGVGGIKHWTLNSSSYNSYHEDVDVVAYLNESNKFQFVGDDDTVYIINGPVTKTYHVNYTGFAESDLLWGIAFEEIVLNGINGMDELEDWWNDAHQFGHPRNRRITYHIPIQAFTSGAPDDPTSSGSNFNPIAPGNADATNTGIMRFVEESWISVDNQVVPENPAIWETEPKEDTGLDIYYETGSTFPLEINDETNYNFAPVGSTVTANGITAEVVGWNTTNLGLLNVELSEVIYHLNGIITFHRSDGSCVTAVVQAMESPLTQTSRQYMGK